MTETPETFEDLRDAMHSKIGDLAKGQQRIAQLLLSDPEGTAFRSIRQTAELAQVHESSLVRFATLFGLNGYPAIVALCRNKVATEAHLVSRLNAAQDHNSFGSLLKATLEHEQDNLARTFARTDETQWEDAINALDQANYIYVMGLRKCLPVAQLLTYLLRLVRPNIEHLAPISGMLADELRDMEPSDAFVAISINRYTADTVTAFEEAKARGLKTIALTDTGASPLARIADITFLVNSEGVTILRSVTSFVSLVQALATGVATRNGTRSREELKSDEYLLEQFSVYWQ